MDQDQHTRASLGERLAMVVGGEVAFAMLVDLVTGDPPGFITTVAFGAMLALGLSWQARVARV